MMTIEQIKDMAHNDATTACRESGDTQAPDGGWDSWLINGIGFTAVCELFGENPDESASGWSDAMAAKLRAYHAAACEAAEQIEEDTDWDGHANEARRALAIEACDE